MKIYSVITGSGRAAYLQRGSDRKGKHNTEKQCQLYLSGVQGEKLFQSGTEALCLSAGAQRCHSKGRGSVRVRFFRPQHQPHRADPGGPGIYYRNRAYAGDSAGAGRQLCTLHSGTAAHSKYWCSDFFLHLIPPPILQDFQRGHPHCQINVIEASDNDLIECLQKDIIDSCLTVQTWSGHMFQTTAIGEEDIVLAVPEAAPMNKRLSEYQLGPDDLKSASRLRDDCPRISIGEFKELPFLLLKQGNDMYSRGVKICKQGGFVPNTFVTLDQLLTSYHMAAAGTGAAFIRAGRMRYASGGVCFYGLDSKDTVCSIHLVCKKTASFLIWFRIF